MWSGCEIVADAEGLQASSCSSNMARFPFFFSFGDVQGGLPAGSLSICLSLLLFRSLFSLFSLSFLSLSLSFSLSVFLSRMSLFLSSLSLSKFGTVAAVTSEDHQKNNTVQQKPCHICIFYYQGFATHTCPSCNRRCAKQT